MNKEISKIGSAIQKDQASLENLSQEAADAQILKDRIQDQQTDLTDRRKEISQLRRVKEQLQSQSDELEDIRQLRNQGECMFAASQSERRDAQFIITV